MIIKIRIVFVVVDVVLVCFLLPSFIVAVNCDISPLIPAVACWTLAKCLDADPSPNPREFF